MTLVDTNVLLDVASADPLWLQWSIQQLDERAALGPVIINDVVYAEMSAQMDTEAELLQTLRELHIVLERMPTRALFLAGKIYRRYRSFGGIRTGVIPDFFIGAHARVLGFPILTRDVRRYRTYFPDVALITPRMRPPA
jgi:predicted nucleic acid-binding protein